MTIAGGERVQPHPVCGHQVRIEVLGATRPGDFEYRFQAVRTAYYEPEGTLLHHCVLKPRRLQIAAQEIAEPPAPRRRETPPPPSEPPAAAETPPEPEPPARTRVSFLDRYAGGLDS